MDRTGRENEEDIFGWQCGAGFLSGEQKAISGEFENALFYVA